MSIKETIPLYSPKSPGFCKKTKKGNKKSNLDHINIYTEGNEEKFKRPDFAKSTDTDKDTPAKKSRKVPKLTKSTASSRKAGKITKGGPKEDAVGACCGSDKDTCAIF